MISSEKYIAEKIKTQVLLKNPNADVILFGSHARGDYRENSDWDILILLNQTNVSRLVEKEYRDILFETELEIEVPISVFVFSKNDWEQKYNITPLYQNIKKDGIRL